ncbi:tyrosine-type recombinase/integrase [uncultured Succinivibrio sp.]|jgi:site-specific recombinase XerD|uniref:tyrosine-type recombinase/integrase n=1 Tax=uncultured Succinivibrio sp. TaxID=540749 RepID=UPI0025DEFF43|nr:tyrosine-type recombinase/integrase [uncultured Succinivibrio sp.]
MDIAELKKIIDKTTVIDSLSVYSLNCYRTYWRKLYEWLTANNIYNFGETEIHKYLEETIYKTEYSYAELSRKQKTIALSCNALINYINTGKIGRKSFIQLVDFDAQNIGNEVKYYKEFLQSVSFRIKPQSTRIYKYALSILYRYCLNHTLSLSELNYFHLSRLFDGSNLSHKTIYNLKLYIKIFLQWLFFNSYTTQDLSIFIPREKYIKEERLPTTFTDNEVKAILKCIDRGTALGRRDFAILLCIAAYGWRISDIAQLKLEYINWRNQTISFNQVKTGEPIHTKLEPLVFNAIVDYIQHGRPNDQEYDKLNSGELFLLLSEGNIGKPLRPHTVENIFYKYIRRAGISNLSNRRHGCHALRFSLATRMIENGADIRDVKVVLGHKDKSITFNYVKLDISRLKQCNLPMVPCISPFYSDLKKVN